MDKAKQKRERRARAHRRVRKSVRGTEQRPRLAVYKSLRYIYAQLIDDVSGKTLVQANSGEASLRKELKAGGKSMDAALLVGQTVADRALAKGVDTVVFDRGGYVYHGRVQKVAEGARDKGLKF